MINHGQKLPFDIYAERALEVDLSDLTSHKRLRQDIKKFISHTAGKQEYHSPIFSAVGVAAELRESSQHVIAELAENVATLQSSVEDLESELAFGGLSELNDSVEQLAERMGLVFKLVNDKIKPIKVR